MRTDMLIKANKDFYEKNKSKYTNFLHMGFFFNNHILILGMNPENPWSESQKTTIDDVNKEEDYFKREQKYYNIIKNTKVAKYLNEIFGESWNHLSYTNLVKTVTPDKSGPSQELVNEFKTILDTQIKTLNPTVVICLGKFVGHNFGIDKFYEVKKTDNINYFMIPHPEYWNNNGQSREIIDKIKFELENLFKSYAIVKVSNKKIYYRNAKFEKCSYDNTEDNSFCFIKCDEASQYKSYDGYNLEKVRRDEVDSLGISEKDTYEKHLTKKDVFYYNNYGRISNAKMLRYLLLDIENDFSNDVINVPKPVTSISFYDNLTNKYSCFVYKFKEEQVVNKIEGKDIKSFDTEKELIEAFLDVAKKCDLLSGWYSQNFDFCYLFRRAQKLKINLKNYFDNIWIDENSIDEFRCFIDSHILHDSMVLYQKFVYFDKPPSFSLDVVSRHLFKEKGGKLEHNSPDVLWRNDINHLIRYNIRDVELLKMIVDHANLIDYPILMQVFCTQDYENVIYNSRTIENLLHQRYWNKNIFFPTKITHQKLDFEGAVVLEPIKGLHKNVATFDFSAQYTNVYLSFNYSPDTLVGEKQEVESNFDIILKNIIERYPAVNEFIKDKSKLEILSNMILVQNDFGQHYFLPTNWKLGVLPALEREMLSMRKYYTDIRDSFPGDSAEYKIYEEIQGTSKVILNSIYGVVGYNRFILFNPIIPASITSTARQLHQWTQLQCRNKGYVPLYGDTDSLQVKFSDNLEFDDFISEVMNFSVYLNSTFKDFMKKFTQNQFVINNQTNKLEFEKAYLRLRLTDVKKRYFGYVKYYKGKILDIPKLNVVGFDSRRNDLPSYFKPTLLNIYKMFLEDDYSIQIKKYYKEIKKDIKTKDIDNFISRIKLSRNLDMYKKMVPMHVKAARNVNAKIKRGEYIRMLHVKDSREVIHHDESDLSQEFEIDYDRYLEKYFVDKCHLIDDSINFENTTLGDYFK